MTIDFYGYKQCDTCRKAEKSLQAAGVSFRFIDITQEPPSRAILEQARQAGFQIGELFNRSGVAYRELNMKDKLKTMSEGEALDLLASHGRLCKRPVVTDGDRVTVGFQPDRFQEIWSPA